jgi:hypothetical protein
MYFYLKIGVRHAYTVSVDVYSFIKRVEPLIYIHCRVYFLRKSYLILSARTFVDVQGRANEAQASHNTPAVECLADNAICSYSSLMVTRVYMIQQNLLTRRENTWYAKNDSP